MKKIEIVEVGPRDGLQNEVQSLSVDQRLNFIDQLVAAGLRRIEVGAFVSPKWVPQMNQSFELIQELLNSKRKYPKDVRFSALVPNRKGMELAEKTSLKEIAVFGASSESFSQKNINCSMREGLERFQEVIKMARPTKIKVRGYLSVAFGCPYEGLVKESVVRKQIEKYLELGMYEISIGDTIGVATPKQVRSLLKKVSQDVGLKKVAMHFHDTRGTALANVLASLDLGVRVFDSSFGGLGGCPYAKGASGNLATEDLVYMLHGMGFETGVKLEKLIQISPGIENLIQHGLPSRVARAGLPL